MAALDDQVLRVGQTLTQTLSADSAVRKAAEAALEATQTEPGHVVVLFRLCADTSLPTDPQLRQAAVIRMKNIIQRRWTVRPQRKGEPELPALPEEDKALVRNNLGEALIFAPPLIRSQLGLCVRCIAYSDYPEQWPGLLDAIVTNLASGDQQRLAGGLFTLRVLAKTYEFQREEKRVPLHAIVDATFPRLVALLDALLAQPPNAEYAELALLATKVMWSVTQLALPPLLLDPKLMDGWFSTLTNLLEQPLPAGAPDDADEASKWPPWKVKKRVAGILHRIVQRHGNPSRKPEGPNADALSVFATHFQASSSARCLQACLRVLGQAAPGSAVAVPPRVLTLCLNYVDESIKFKVSYQLLKPQLLPLFTNVIFPRLCFDDADAERWEEDATEFVCREFDVIEEFYSPRAAARTLLLTLTEKRPKDCLHQILSSCSEVLAASAGSADPAAARQKDGALLAIGTLHDRLSKKAAYRPSLEPMLSTHVEPDFSSPERFLRLRACWVYAQFAKSLFPRKRGKNLADSWPSPTASDTEPAQAAIFHKVLGCMRDPELPVRVQAALTVNEFVQSGCVDATVLSLLPQLVEALFALMNDIGNDEVIQSLDTLIEKYGEQMEPYAVQVVSALAANFMRLVDESDGDDEDDTSLAAMGVMQALSTMMHSVKGKPEVFSEMEGPLLPLIRRCCHEDAQDFAEDMLEVLSYLTFYAPTISAELWTIYPLLCEAVQTWGHDLLTAFLSPLDNYISRGTEYFLTAESGRFLTMAIAAARRVLLPPEQGELMDSEQYGGAKLLESVLHNCRGRVDAVFPELLSLALMCLEQLDAESVNLRVLLSSTLSSALHYNPALALQVLAHRQAVETTLGGWVEHLSKCPKLRLHDIKVGLLGASSLLALPDASAGALVSSSRLLLVRLHITLFRKFNEHKEKLDKLAELGEGEEDEELEEDEDAGELGDDDDGKEGGTDMALSRLLGANFASRLQVCGPPRTHVTTGETAA